MHVLAIAVGLYLLIRSLPKALENLWDELWEHLFEWVVEAEAKWTESGRGAEKLAWLQEQAMSWITERVKLNWLQRIIAGYVVRSVVSAMVAQFNEIVGKDWLKQAQEAKEYWEGRFPFLSGADNQPAVAE